MAINYPGPYEIRIYYTVQTFQHVQRLNLRVDGTPTPGTAFDAIDALRRDNSPYPLDGEVDQWVTLLRPLIPSAGGTVDYAELWKYTPGTFEGEFVSTYDISLAGTGATAYQPAGQQIFVFRTLEGGIMKINVMEAIRTATTRIVYSAMTTAEKALVDAVQNGTVPWLGRDTSYPFAVIGLYPGQNEALFKKRFRQ